jgi:hypothetical protein
MIAYQTNLDGYFAGIIEADESPLEPGVFLIPGGAVTVSPPEAGPGSAARWIDGAWQIVPVPDAPPAIDPPTPPTEAELLASWRARTVVSAFQAKEALFDRGLLAAAEAAAVAAGGRTLRAWNTATEYARLSPAIVALAPVIGITDPLDLDELFREAALISA